MKVKLLLFALVREEKREIAFLRLAP